MPYQSYRSMRDWKSKVRSIHGNQVKFVQKIHGGGGIGNVQARDSEDNYLGHEWDSIKQKGYVRTGEMKTSSVRSLVEEVLEASSVRQSAEDHKIGDLVKVTKGLGGIAGLTGEITNFHDDHYHVQFGPGEDHWAVVHKDHVVKV